MIRVFAIIIIFTTAAFAQIAVTPEYLLGKTNPAKDPRFTKIAGTYLRGEAAAAFQKMADEAKKAGVGLRVESGTRTFVYQKNIWEDKWKGRRPLDSDTGEKLPGLKDRSITDIYRANRILELSAMPGTSRHHWGTDIDINNVNTSYWATKRGKKEYAWLSENAAKFGFCQVYSAGRTAGFSEEKWHWSYIPVAARLTLDYERLITNNDISALDFLGSKTAIELNAVANYVLGINSACK